MNRYRDTQYIHGITISWGREEQLEKSLKKFLSGVRTNKKKDWEALLHRKTIAGFLTKIHNIRYTLEKTLQSPLDCQEIQPVHPKGDQSWVFIGRTDAEAETPILWPPHAKSWVTGKDPDAGRDWGQEEKGTTEDEMGGWRHWLDGHGFGWMPGVGDGQGGLVCWGSWGHKESDTTERLNWTELIKLLDTQRNNGTGQKA